MPTSQAPILLQLIDDIERQLELAGDPTDLHELRAILSRPTQVAISERTYLLTMLKTLSEQLDLIRNLRAGLIDSIRQARPMPPERHE